jgi:hypothetical protein
MIADRHSQDEPKAQQYLLVLTIPAQSANGMAVTPGESDVGW